MPEGYVDRGGQLRMRLPDGSSTAALSRRARRRSPMISISKPSVAAALEEKESGGALRLVTFSVDAADADAIGDEPIWHEGRVIGWVTSGGYGHRVQRSLALGYIPVALDSAGDGFEIEIIGERRRARPASAALLDPSGSRMRS